MPATELDQIVNLCKRRGFVYPSAEIYGGFRSTYDYGPLGSLLLRNVKDAWVRSMVQQRDDVVLIDAADPRPAPGVGGVRPPRELHRPARRLHELQEPLPRRQARRPRTPARAAARRHVHRGPRVQPDVQDPGRAGRGSGRRRLPAARDRAGHVHQLRQRAADQPQEAAVRHRPGRQELPQRDHAAELDLPHPRVRADGDGVLRAARRERRSGTSTGATSASTGTSTSASRPTCCACGRTTTTSCRTTRPGTSDVEFLFPWGWDELEGIAQRTDFDLKAHAEHSGERLDYFDQQTNERYVPYVIEPAAGATRTMAAFLLAAYDEDDGQRRDPHRAAPAPAPRAVQGRRAAAVEEGHADAARPRGPQRCSATATWSTTTRRRRSASATAARTRSARRCASRSTSTRSTTTPSPSATATRWSRSACPIDDLLQSVTERLGF